jgi:hypothetical protein
MIDNSTFLDLFRIFSKPDKLTNQFVARNKQFFDQSITDPKVFLNKLIQDNFSQNFDLKIHYPNTTPLSLFYIYGVPILIVDRLPWDSQSNGLLMGGRCFDLGIICAYYSEIEIIVKHELTHVLMRWLKEIDVFKLPRLTKDGPLYLPYEDLRNTTLAHFRDETITHLIANPGVISERSKDLVVRSLSGKAVSQLKPIFSHDFRLLDSIINAVITIDKGHLKMSREKLAQIMLENTNCSSIIKVFNEHVRA